MVDGNKQNLRTTGERHGDGCEPPATPLEENGVSSERSNMNVADHAVAAGSARNVYLGRGGADMHQTFCLKLVNL